MAMISIRGFIRGVYVTLASANCFFVGPLSHCRNPHCVIYLAVITAGHATVLLIIHSRIYECEESSPCGPAINIISRYFPITDGAESVTVESISQGFSDFLYFSFNEMDSFEIRHQALPAIYSRPQYIAAHNTWISANFC